MLGKTSPVFCPQRTFSKRDWACCLPSQPPLLPISVFMVIMLVRARNFLKKLVFVFNHKRIVCSSRYKIFFKKIKKNYVLSEENLENTEEPRDKKKRKDTKMLGDPLNPDQPL